MALKLIFKFTREAMQENDNEIKIILQGIFDDNGITTSHMYKPARHSIKVLFPTEKDIDKVLEKEEAFKTKNFEPRVSLSLKSCRTIFCTNFDAALLETYTRENIMNILKQEKWNVRDVYIMKSKKSFKIEMATRNQAKKIHRTRKNQYRRNTPNAKFKGTRNRSNF